MTEQTKLNPRALTTLSAGLTLRPVQWTDVNAVAKLIYDVCEADGDVTVATTAEELENEWKNEGFDMERDAFVVETRDGRIVGYEEFFHPQGVYHDLDADGYVHPQFKGMGIGRTLLRAVEKRAREEMELAAPDLRVFIRNTIDNKDKAGRDLFKSEGYFPVRYHWRMEVKLTAPPAPAAFPEGVELRPFIKDEHAVAGNRFGRAGLDVFDNRPFDAVFALNGRNRRIQPQFDVGIGGVDLGHQFFDQHARRAKFLPPMYHNDLFGVLGQMQRILDGGVAAADSDDDLILKKRRIAGAAIADAHSGLSKGVLARHAQAAVRTARRQNRHAPDIDILIAMDFNCPVVAAG